MNFLLDTHVMLWFLNDDAKLAPEVRDEIEKCKNVLEKLEDNPSAIDFLEPVDWQGILIYLI
jgi:hypothetical protein